MNEHRIERLENNLERLENTIERLTDLIEDLHIHNRGTVTWRRVTFLCPADFEYTGLVDIFEKSRVEEDGGVRVVFSVRAISDRHAYRLGRMAVSKFIVEE